MNELSELQGQTDTFQSSSSVGDSALINGHSAVKSNLTEKHVYLDYNATTTLASDVIETISSALRMAWGNPSSSHTPGVLAKSVINEARDRVACMIGANSEDIIFTSGGTESNNLVIHSVVHAYLAERTEATAQESGEGRAVAGKRPHIITSNLEHDSVALVLKNMESRGDADVTYVPACYDTGRVRVDDILNAVRAETCLITCMLANNETGILQPIGEICARVSAILPKRNAASLPRIYVHTDAAQAIGKVRVNVQDLGVDFLTIVGHKFYGPRIGALYVRRPGTETPLRPMLYGGGQERNFRPGTENTPMIAGLGMACELVSRHIAEYETHMSSVRDYLEERLLASFGSVGVHFNGRINRIPRLPNTCNVSLVGPELRGAQVLSRCHVLQASVGAACHSGLHLKASCILLASGIPEDIALNAVRLSVGRETTKDDIDVVIADIQQAVERLNDTTSI